MQHEVADGDHAVGVDEVCAGEWDPIPGVIVGWDKRVQDAERRDDLRVRVGEQRKRDAVGGAEVGQGVGFVVADRIESDLFGVQCLIAVLQLDQLRATRRSPHRRTIEHHRGRLAGPIPVHIDDLPIGGLRHYVREPLAHLRTRRELAPRVSPRAGPRFEPSGEAVGIYPQLIWSGVGGGLELDVHSSDTTDQSADLADNSEASA